VIRVVLVDDHPMFREGLRFTLERAEDIQVVGEAADGHQALDLIAEVDPDVVVMDLAMPRLDGLAATERLAADGARAGILVLTFSEEDAAVFAAVRAGARGYLVKGVAAEQVVSGVRAVATGHAVFGPGLATRMLEFFGGGRPREPRFPELSEREHEVLAHLANAWTNQQIADELVISPITVRNHVSSILTKLRLTNRREAMLRYHDR
jgi:DNA-binding NarL/FixJ family response regulator